MSGTGFRLPLLGHAFGRRYDLPVPLWLFVLGGAAVVFVSFLVVLPRAVAPAADPGGVGDDGGGLHRPSPVRWAISGLILVALAITGWLGSQVVAENIVPTFFWLVVWVAVPVSCGIVGNWTRPVNPFAAVARLADRPGLRGALLASKTPLRWPQRLGWWPAVGLFFVVASGELVFNGTATLPAFTADGLAVYTCISAAGGYLFGAEPWVQRGELFSVLFGTWGRLGWFRFGAPGRRGFGGGLVVRFERSASRITFVLMLLVSVSYDGLLSTDAWKSRWR